MNPESTDANGWWRFDEKKPEFDEFVWICRKERPTMLCRYSVGRYRRIGENTVFMEYRSNRTIYDVEAWAPIVGPVE